MNIQAQRRLDYSSDCTSFPERMFTGTVQQDCSPEGLLFVVPN
jgi:hypothetical protein